MDMRRAIVAVALAGLVLVAGTKIPLPGMDIGAAAARMSGSADGLSRLSIFALGLVPLYNALALVEIGRLFLTPLGSSPRYPGLIETAAVGVIALGVTALQGYGIVQALAGMGMLDGQYPIIGLCTYMGATALMVFLCHRVRLPGFRSGFWALWSVPALLGLPPQVAYAFDLARTGAISGLPLLLSVVHLSLSVAAIVVMAAVWSRACGQGHEQGGGGDAIIAPRDILIWPPVMASVIVGYLLTLVAVIAPAIVNTVNILILQTGMLTITCLLVPVFVFAYLRHAEAILPQDRRLAPAAAVIIAVQVALLVSGGILNVWGGLPVQLGFISLLAVTLTVLALFPASAGPSLRRDTLTNG